MRFNILKDSKLYGEQYCIGDITIPSRFFLSPINTGFADDGNINSRFIDFYAQRSGHGIGITYVGNVAVGKELTPNSNTPLISYDSLGDWRKLTSIISENGSIPGIQLACRTSKTMPLKGWRIKNIKAYLENVRTELKNLSKDNIHSVLNNFINSAELSIKAGFKVIQIHAAHGYFLAQLLDHRVNVRDDKFGVDPLSSIESLTSAIRLIDDNVIIDIRLSLVEGFEDKDVEYERKVKIIDGIVRTGIDMISLSCGTYDVNKSLIYPPKSHGHGTFIYMAVPLALKYPNILWNIAGNIFDLRKLPPTAPNNLTYGIARSLIADPKLIDKSLSGSFETIRCCIRKGDCHYYSRGINQIYCPLTPSLNGNVPELASKCLPNV